MARIGSHLLAVTTPGADVVGGGIGGFAVDASAAFGGMGRHCAESELTSPSKPARKIVPERFRTAIAPRKTRESSIFTLKRYEQNKLRVSVY